MLTFMFLAPRVARACHNSTNDSRNSDVKLCLITIIGAQKNSAEQFTGKNLVTRSHFSTQATLSVMHFRLAPLGASRAASAPWKSGFACTVLVHFQLPIMLSGNHSSSDNARFAGRVIAIWSYCPTW